MLKFRQILIITFIYLLSCNNKKNNAVIFNDELINCLSDNSIYTGLNKDLNIFISKSDSEKVVIPLYLLKDIYSKSIDSFYYDSYKEFLDRSIKQTYFYNSILLSNDDCFILNEKINQEYYKGGYENLLKLYFTTKKLKNGIVKYELINQAISDRNTVLTIFYYLFLNGFFMIESDLGKYSYGAIFIKDMVNCE
jgi:hypothetical protein